MSVVMEFGGHVETEILFSSTDTHRPLVSHEGEQNIGIVGHSDLQPLLLQANSKLEHIGSSSTTDENYGSSFNDYSQTTPNKCIVGGDNRPIIKTRRRRSPPNSSCQDINDKSLVSIYTFFKSFLW